MALDRHLILSNTAGDEEFDVHGSRREQIGTMVAASLAILVVATIALLMGMA
jgi:hypothetical protein